MTEGNTKALVDMSLRVTATGPGRGCAGRAGAEKRQPTKKQSAISVRAGGSGVRFGLAGVGGVTG